MRIIQNIPSILPLLTMTSMLSGSSTGFADLVILNEVMSANELILKDEDGNFEDWIELFNSGDDPIDLTGYGLSDDGEDPFKWKFPEVTMEPQEYLLLWASGKDRRDPLGALHTNFSVSFEGEEILLSNKEGVLLDELSPSPIPQDTSIGRAPGNLVDWVYFTEATPGEANETTVYTGLTKPPVFSHEAGFYTEEFQLNLTGENDEVTIYFTLDGSEPDPSNLHGTTFAFKNEYPKGTDDPFGEILYSEFRTHLYKDPLLIKDRTGEQNLVTRVSTTSAATPNYLPKEPLFRGTSIRAIALREGHIPSPIITKSYFVSPLGEDRYTLPVINITTREDSMFGYEDGIYTAGKDFDEWRKTNTTDPGDWFRPKNYNRRGDEAEHPAFIEVFWPNQGRVLAQGIGWRIHGNASRGAPQKSVRLYARSEYDQSNSFDFPFFENLTQTGGSGNEVDSFRRLILRNSGQDDYATRMRDGFLQTVLAPIGLDQQAFQPAIHFFNGEFWGHINIRERLDPQHLASHHDIDEENVIILEKNAEISDGTQEDRDLWLSLRNYIVHNNLSSPGHYSYVSERMDIDNFIRYNTAQIYIDNTDWPANNASYWRVREPDLSPGAPWGADGRWRWMLFDLDDGFGRAGELTPEAVQANSLEWATTPGGVYGQTWSTEILLSLLANSEFKHRFVNTMADHINTTFKPDRIDSITDDIREKIEPYLSETQKRWRTYHASSANYFKEYGRSRPGIVLQHYVDYFELEGTQQLTLDVVGEGNIRVNSITIDEKTPGLSDTNQPYPWSGLYFEGIPVELEAIASDGYRFAGWVGSITETDSPRLTVSLNDSAQFTAVFEEMDPPGLLHYWNFNDDSALLEPNFTLGNARIDIYTGPEASVEDDNESGFLGANARFGDSAGRHLRINSPIGSETIIQLPTDGYRDPVVAYEVRRSGQGAGTQLVDYTIDGDHWIPFAQVSVLDDDPVLQQITFADIPSINDNHDFAIRLRSEQGDGGNAGNHRIDNLTMDATPLDGVVPPPFFHNGPTIRFFIEDDEPIRLPLSELFSSSVNLTVSVSSSNPLVSQATLVGDMIVVAPRLRGDAVISVSVDDEINPQVTTTFRTLVYPEALSLQQEDYFFGTWDPDNPRGSFPPHTLFLQSDQQDPELDTPLLHAYDIPLDDYHSDDEETIGFPYNNTRRTRVTGLGPMGISIVNTGRDRDLGGVLAAVDTRGLDQLEVSWLAGTILRNTRDYGIRLQYRVGIDGPFSDVLIEGEPIEYLVGADDDLRLFTPIPLPNNLLEQPYLQFLWRAYFIDGDSGSRPEFRLDNLSIGRTAIAPPLEELWIFY